MLEARPLEPPAASASTVWPLVASEASLVASEASLEFIYSSRYERGAAMLKDDEDEMDLDPDIVSRGETGKKDQQAPPRSSTPLPPPPPPPPPPPAPAEPPVSSGNADPPAGSTTDTGKADPTDARLRSQSTTSCSSVGSQYFSMPHANNIRVARLSNKVVHALRGCATDGTTAYKPIGSFGENGCVRPETFNYRHCYKTHMNLSSSFNLDDFKCGTATC
jgi:hypothetical protein